MKLSSISFFIATLILVNCLSCSKDSDNITTYPIHGLWIGTYTVNSSPGQGSLFYSLTIYPDGSLLTKGKGGDGKDYYSTGTWTLTGPSSFSGTIISLNPPPGVSPITQRIVATFSNTGTMTNGTWNDINNPNGPALSGNLSTMQRVN